MSLLVVNYESEQYNKQIDDVNGSLDATALMHETLRGRIGTGDIKEVELMKWARYVKLASENADSIKDLEKHAVERILRSWKSIVGIIILERSK